MQKLVFLLLALVGVQGGKLPNGPGEGRIVDGTEATIQQYPYTVSIQRNGIHACAGAIYSNNVIITAAHCLITVPVASLKVRYATSFHNSGGTFANVRNYRIHENYDPATMDNDIAVIRLSTNITLNVNAAVIALATVPASNGDQGVITGWGSPYNGAGYYSSKLQMATIATLKRNDCANFPYGYSESQLTKSMLCGVGNGKDACQGDAGGPFVFNKTLIGIISWGFGCGNQFYPGVYTDVVVLRDWIVYNAQMV